MKTLRLTESQMWLVFHGLQERVEHAEIMAAMEFENTVTRKFTWSNFGRVSMYLNEMREAHALRLRLFPDLFGPPARTARMSVPKTLRGARASLIVMDDPHDEK